MARMRTLHPPMPQAAGPDMSVIADVDLHVGRGGENNTTDVQLVQFLLNFAIPFVKGLSVGPMRDSTGREIQSVDVDGICGPVTRDAILSFQRSLAAEFGKGQIATDGLVSPSRGRTQIKGGQVGLFTIVWLNMIRRLDRETDLNPDDVDVEPLRSTLLASTRARATA